MAFSDQHFTSQQKQRICCILSSLATNNKDLKVRIQPNKKAFKTKFLMKSILCLVQSTRFSVCIYSTMAR